MPLGFLLRRGSASCSSITSINSSGAACDGAACDRGALVIVSSIIMVSGSLLLEDLRGGGVTSR